MYKLHATPVLHLEIPLYLAQTVLYLPSDPRGHWLLKIYESRQLYLHNGLDVKTHAQPGKLLTVLGLMWQPFMSTTKHIEKRRVEN